MTILDRVFGGGGSGPQQPARFTFLFKVVGALGLVALADALFYFQRVGSTVALFGLAMLVLLVYGSDPALCEAVRAPWPWGRPTVRPRLRPATANAR